MDGIILVGGFGKRLLPLTKTLPKPLIPLANAPFLPRAIAWLREEGVRRIILSLHYNAEQFIEHCAGAALGVELFHAVEETPLGTGGAIKNCEPYLRDERCCVMNGDIFTNLSVRDMLAAHRRSGAQASIALHRVDDPSRFGVIETDDDGRIRSFTEKPPRALARSNAINAGMYIFERNIFDYFPATPCSVEREIFPALLRDGVHLYGYGAQLYWTDLGTPRDYLQAHRDILAGVVRMPMPARNVAPGIWMGDDVDIAPSAHLTPPILVGAGTVIESNASVGPMVTLGARVCIAAGADVADSVLWDEARVQPDSYLRHSILGRRARVAGIAEDIICEDDGVVGLPEMRPHAA